MLMKMSQYKSVTTFIVSIFIANILLALLVAMACDELKDARDDAFKAYIAADERVTLQWRRKPDYVIIGTLASMPGAYVRGALVYASVGGTLLGALGSGGIIIGVGAASAYVAWSGVLWMYEKELNQARDAYYEADAEYEACANPPAQYTYTCGDCNDKLYEFTDYNTYINFIRIHPNVH